MNRRERRGAAKKVGGAAQSPALEAYRRGDAEYNSGRLAAAEEFYLKALALDPGHVKSLYQLGAVALRGGRFEDAVARFEQVIARDPAIAEAHTHLGIALHKLGRYEAALDCSLRAAALRPGYGEAHSNAGMALHEMMRFEEAIAQFRLAGPQPHFRQNLAMSLTAAGRHEEALAIAAAVIAMHPGSPDAHRNMASLFLSLGRMEKARAALARAIALNPRSGASYFLLAETGQVTADEIRQMAALLAEADGLAPADRIELQFALARALTDSGERAAGFDHYLKANALKRQQTPYDEAATLDGLDRIGAGVTADFIARHRPAGDPSQVPVFILGMPRSGTTLVEQILASHPGIATAGERTEFATQIRRQLQADDAPLSFLDHLDTLRPEQFGRLGSAYVAAMRMAAPQAARIIDKMPANFRFAGLIHAALPNARIIHVRRDAVDTCLSCFSQLFGGEQTFAYELGELGRYWTAYDRLMARWRAVIPATAMLEVRYEDLVADFEPQARRIVAHTGLAWHDDCLRFHDSRRPVTTASWMQVRKPVYQSSVGRWRPDAALLQPLLDGLAL